MPQPKKALPPVSETSPLSVLEGIGPRRAEALARAGLTTVGDLIHYFPRAYLDRRWTTPVSLLAEGMEAVVQGRIRSPRLGFCPGRRRVFRAVLEDAGASIGCTWFNQPYLAKRIREGDEVVLCGKAVRRGELGLVNPEIVFSPSGTPEGLVPVYPLVEGLSQKLLRRTVECALAALKIEEPFPASLLSAWGIPGRALALREMHFPPDYPALEAARRRLVLEEFLFLQVGLLFRKERLARVRRAPELRFAGENFPAWFEGALPFRLTGAQLRAIGEIQADLAAPAPMRRLLLGEVGSGKTLVAAAAAVLAIRAGRQVAVMAPTEVLARQLDRTLGGLIRHLGGKTLFLGGEAASRPAGPGPAEADLAVGTQALLGKGVDLPRLGLVVIDEQHRFGVNQKAGLARKGDYPHVLVMTATPIPRTLAYTVYGDLDFSVLDELPPGRPGIKTWWIGPEKLPGAYRFIREEVGRGRQAYVVYPMVEGSGKRGEKSVSAMHPVLSRGVFRGLRTALLHGKLSSGEKAEVMARFASGELDILVATTALELGVDVANATVILIEGAERFGLAQLHQLRGRVGRGPHPSFCILQGAPSTPAACSRLLAAVKIDDGFFLARRDMEIRGPGQFYGIRQHGLPELRLGDLLGDIALLETARREARRIVASDPGLRRPENRVFRARIPVGSLDSGL